MAGVVHIKSIYNMRGTTVLCKLVGTVKVEG